MRKRKTWLRVLLIIALLLLAFGAGFFVQRIAGTAFAVQQQGSELVEENPEVYSWTFALCTFGGRCMDVKVECNGTRVLNTLSVTEIGGHDFGWEDPRGGNPRICPWQRLSDNKD